MPKKNPLLSAPPYQVDQALKRLGGNLRTARLRRRLSLEDVAQKIGIQRQTVSDAEKGNPSTSAAVYMALLWTYDLIGQMEDVANPLQDAEGQALAASREPNRARHNKDIDNDF
jgi:transcriptional regulator with XRE-family HTH domain